MSTGFYSGLVLTQAERGVLRDMRRGDALPRWDRSGFDVLNGDDLVFGEADFTNIVSGAYVGNTQKMNVPICVDYIYLHGTDGTESRLGVFIVNDLEHHGG